jgi:dTDP-glucose 4,6-dehydratase
MDLAGSRVLVTGAGGFIGSHLAEGLVKRGATVRAMVHYNSGGRWGWLDESPLRREMEIISGDIRDQGFVFQAARGCEVVFHLAALIAIPYSYSAPSSYIQTNITGTYHVLEAARQLGHVRVIHTSTSEVYGSALRVPIDEDHPLQGQSPYSASKIGADKMVEAYHCSFNVPATTVRPFNTFGPRQSARAVLPTIISQCLTQDVVRLGSVHPTRDWNFVTNTVEGFLRAATTDAAIGQTINVGSGTEVSVGDAAKLIARLIGRPVRIESEEQRQRPDRSEVQRLLANNQRARTVLGWQPAVSLEEGLRKTIDWCRENTARFRPDRYQV